MMADEVYYKIKGSTLTAIADFIRTATGTKDTFKPSAMLTQLGRVKYILQGRANDNFALEFNSLSSTKLPLVVKSNAVSEFNLIFTTIIS